MGRMGDMDGEIDRERTIPCICNADDVGYAFMSQDARYSSVPSQDVERSASGWKEGADVTRDLECCMAWEPCISWKPSCFMSGSHGNNARTMGAKRQCFSPSDGKEGIG